MKKIVFFSAIALLCASVVFAAGITKKSLADLKGTWEGTAQTGGSASCNVKIEIMNAAEPVEAKMTLTGLPAKAKEDYGISDPLTGESKSGKITSAGTIMFLGQSPSNFFEITSIGKDKKLNGWFFFNGLKANVSATKK